MVPVMHKTAELAPARVMDMNKDNIAVSALYTAATWRWARFDCAEFVTPAKAQSIFRLVNAFMFFYRLLNPRVFSLQHQLLHRHSAIDYLLWHAGNQRVVEVACGLSARGSRFSANPAIHYVELDLPDMVSFKLCQLAGSEQGRAVLARKNFELRAADVTTLDFTREFAGDPISVITEGLMMYFPREVQLVIWKRIADLLRASGGDYLFDYVPSGDEPQRSWLGNALHLFKEKVLGLRNDFKYDGRTRADVVRDLQDCGFEVVEANNTGDVARPWSLPDANVPSRTIIYHCRCAGGRS
jgi:O-methyltransferase involved in polyketide biosynthesis